MRKRAFHTKVDRGADGCPRSAAVDVRAGGPQGRGGGSASSLLSRRRLVQSRHEGACAALTVRISRASVAVAVFCGLEVGKAMARRRCFRVARVMTVGSAATVLASPARASDTSAGEDSDELPQLTADDRREVQVAAKAAGDARATEGPNMGRPSLRIAQKPRRVSWSPSRRSFRPSSAEC